MKIKNAATRLDIMGSFVDKWCDGSAYCDSSADTTHWNIMRFENTLKLVVTALVKSSIAQPIKAPLKMPIFFFGFMMIIIIYLMILLKTEINLFY
jgi:hypothetical protein